MSANLNVSAVTRLPSSHASQSLISDDASTRITENGPAPPALRIKLFAPHHDDPAHSLPDQWRHAIAEHLPQISVSTSTPSVLTSPGFGVQLQIISGYLEEDGVRQVLRSSGVGFDEVRADCVVSPANSYGIMDGG